MSECMDRPRAGTKTSGRCKEVAVSGSLTVFVMVIGLNHTSDKKIGRPRSGSPICLGENDYRPKWTTRSLITN